MKITVRLAALAIVAGLAGFPVFASEVSPAQARHAAKNWVRRAPGRMGARFRDSEPASFETVSNESGRAIFHAMNLKGGGFVITSGDTRLTPIVAFSSTGSYSGDEDSPLYALLHAGQSRSVSAVERRSESSPGALRTLESRAPGGFAKAEGEWDALLGEESDGPSESDPASDSQISDVRVDKILKTRWGQSRWGSYSSEPHVFSYYIPDNYVCGCVATVGAQIMKRWNMPSGYVPQFSGVCAVDGVEGTYYSRAGYFDWSSMPLSYSETPDISTAQIEAIGKLAYNVAVSVGMSWTKKSSSASSSDLVSALRDNFGYASGSYVTYSIDAGDSGSAVNDFRNALYASLDAGMPAVLAIHNSSAGHSVVADGYGYSSGVLYTHLNMGWSGSDDVWYNLVDESIYCEEQDRVYTEILGLGFNIHPSVAGDVVSGRVLTPSGGPVSGATVRLYSSSGAQLASTTTDAKGIYSFRVTSAASYTVKAVANSVESSAVSFTINQMSTEGWFGYGGCTGNKWGVDISLDVTSSDAYDPADDTAAGGSVISPYTTAQTHGPHTLSSTDSYDFFQIYMYAGRTYVFESTGSSDTYAELFSSASADSSSRVAYNDDGGDGSNFKITYEPTATGTYYLRARLYSIGTLGEYTLRYYHEEDDVLYSVTLGANGGVGGTSNVSVSYGSAMPSITVPTKSGYTFGGYWTTVKTGGVQYYNADGTSARAWDKKSNTILWAKWTAVPVTCKVTLGKNGGTGGDNYVTATYGKAMPTPRTAPKKSGYVFDGYWNTTKAGGKQYYDANMNSRRSWDQKSNTTLWAKWIKSGVSSKVTLMKNGGTGGDNYVTATSGKAMPTPRTAPKLSGWTFAGYWDTTAVDANGNPKGRQYYDANMKSVNLWDKTSPATLYAKWTVKVTLGKNGGTGGDSYVTVIRGKPFPTRTMPTRSGYTFGGYWISSSKKTGQCYNADGTGTSTMKWSTGGTPTIWALWTKVQSDSETLAAAPAAAYTAVSCASVDAEETGEAPAKAGLYYGVLSDGSGTYSLLLDEYVEGEARTASLCIVTEDGLQSFECTLEESDGVLVLVAEDGSVWLVDLVEREYHLKPLG